MNAIPKIARAERRITRKTRVGPRTRGFAGPGHTAVEIFGPQQLAATDPFVLLMEDTLDFRPGQPVGEPHPHAGIETVTFMLEGSLNDAAEGLLETGDVAWMTAGRGVVHSEDVEATGHARILQLWVALPASERGTEPAVQVLHRDAVPVRREPGVEARVYSGRSGVLESPPQGRVPLTLVDLALEANASIEQDLPGRARAFVYVVDGSLRIGDETLQAGHVGWLDAVALAETFVRLAAGPDGARALLYAGAPLAEPLVHRGPFVAGSAAELDERFRAYRAGRFPRIGELVRAAKTPHRDRQKEPRP
jgi:redox-sensitive bicupin YhaK (pirin superfamily)